MGTSTQFVLDTVDPDRLARFWAEALHYKLQDPPTGFASWPAWLKAQGIPESEWNSASAIVDPDGHGPRIYFQQMDTPKLGKNRLHLDLNASGGPAGPIEARKTQGNKEGEPLLRPAASKQKARGVPASSNAGPGENCGVLQDPQ